MRPKGAEKTLLNNMNNFTDLKPGDCLLYKASGLFGRIIALKTWHSISHVEVYGEVGFSFASRDGKGVARYPFRSNGLVVVLRPNSFYCHEAAARWFKTVDGQKYDWWGLLRFFTIGDGKHDRMFCSEFATRLYRSGGLEPFHKNEDADLIAPFQFMTSAKFDRVWEA